MTDRNARFLAAGDEMSPAVPRQECQKENDEHSAIDNTHRYHGIEIHSPIGGAESGSQELRIEFDELPELTPESARALLRLLASLGESMGRSTRDSGV